MSIFSPDKSKRKLQVPPSLSVARAEILDVIKRHPGIKNNDIARQLGYDFDLGNNHIGWFVRKIVDSLVDEGRVERPIPRSTQCWISGTRKK